MNVIIAPSLLSADLAAASSVCERLEKANVKWLHLDIMDGNFVPNITFGPAFVRSLRKTTSLFFDVHLMIEKPSDFVEPFANAGADLLVIHLETTRHPQLVLEKIKTFGIYSGIALNPGTDFSLLRWLLPYLDMILVMGVNPGFSGQKFIPATVGKLKALRRYLQDEGYPVLPIEMDGGAGPGNAEELAAAGANILVSGSAFFGAPSCEMAMKNFETALNPFSNPVSNAVYQCLLGWKPHLPHV